MGLFGALIGSVLGTLLQFILPVIFADFLPVEVTVGISWQSVGFGMVTGLLVSVLFALLPLLKVRNVSPMATLRPETADSTMLKDPARWAVIVGILLFIFGFSFFLLKQVTWALGFTGFVLVAFGALWGVGKLIMWAVRRFLPISLSYPWRQALANLYRPNNQTISLIATIGLGTAMISTLFFLQNQLLQEAKFADKEDQPNMLMFDIQTPQLEDVRSKVTDRKMRILQEVPIVTMQLNEINGIDKKENEEKPDEENYSRWLYNREFRVTYRDTLISSETLSSGTLIPLGAKGDSIFVSLERGFGEGNKMKLGDELVFNVQGRPIKTYIGSFRDVKFNQVSTNFLVLFPNGVLEQAPKFHVIITKTQNDRQAADVQSEIVREFPNISIINLGTIVETLEDILGKISFVIQFMAFFSIATGILVLISSLIISKYQRMRESILLRTLGASSAIVRVINTLEYFFLGSLASLSGILLSFMATFLLGKFVFEMNFSLATTHTQARYALPEIMRRFREEFPKVHLVMHQATPSEIATLLESDQADIGIAAESLRNNESFATFPFYRWYHGVIVPAGHPLTKLKHLTLKAIAQYPIVTYHEGFTGRAMIDETFAKAGLTPEIAMVALDADVIKAYVALGMGVGIVASMAFDDDQDKHLKLLDASELFKENTTVLALRKGRFLRGYVKRFVTLCVRNLSEKELQKAVADEQLRRE